MKTHLLFIVFFISLYIFFLSKMSAQVLYDTTHSKESIDSLKSHCYQYLDNGKIIPGIVDDFGYLGRIGDEYYYYSIYRDTISDVKSESGEDYHSRTVTLYEGKNDSIFVRSVWSFGASVSAYSFGTPELVETKYGFIFHTYIYSGNGGWDDGEYYLHKNGKWIKLEVPNWTDIFSSKIPKGYSFCRGREIDLKTMTIDFGVNKPTDGCCCPTGGSVYAELGIQNNKIVIQEIDYSDKPNE